LKTKNSEYRPDIDGLRALAVLAVFIFHLDVDLVSGGYVGVDIFFVISGYLITKIIANQICNKQFSFVSFYLRRIRRLAPALLFILGLTFVVSFILLSPQHLDRLGKAELASIFSVSNIFFWSESGYFNTGSQLKPLLHTWSLSVEEQYYLVWPLLLLFTIKFFNRSGIWFFLIIIFVVSLFFSERMLAVSPESSFYLTPYRAYEFAIGGLVYMLLTLNMKLKYSGFISIIGLSLMLLPIILYEKQTLFPGVAALLPCVGAGLFIYSGGNTLIGKFFSFKPIVFIGKISYSLYLAHWPTIVLYQYYNLKPLGLLDITLILLITFALAVFMYFYIEKPFRRPPVPINNIKTNKTFLQAILLVISSLVGLSVYAALKDGIPNRFSRDVMRQVLFKPQELNDYTWKAHLRMQNVKFNNNRKVKVLVVGDSQGGDFVNILLTKLEKQKYQLRSIIVSAKCQPVALDDKTPESSVVMPHDVERCKKERFEFTQNKLLDNADVVYLVSNWHEESLKYIKNTMNLIYSKGVNRVYVVGRKSQGAIGTMLALRNRYSDKPIETFSAEIKHKTAWDLNNKLRDIVGEENFVNIMGVVCPSENYCSVLTGEKKLIFHDKLHLTPAGVEYIAERLILPDNN